MAQWFGEPPTLADDPEFGNQHPHDSSRNLTPVISNSSSRGADNISGLFGNQAHNGAQTLM